MLHEMSPKYCDSFQLQQIYAVHFLITPINILVAIPQTRNAVIPNIVDQSNHLCQQENVDYNVEFYFIKFCDFTTLKIWI